MPVTSLDHVSIIVSNTQNAVRFYCGLLGLIADLDRPELRYPGAWLVAGNVSLHLLELPNPDPVEGRPEHGGLDRHTAFYVDHLQDIVDMLEKESVLFTRSRSGRNAIFLRDPDGNGVELIEVP